jgi:hemerythrin-like domain-containing protein
MDAIKLLTQQHREVEELFAQFEEKGEGATAGRGRLCQKIADALAVHTAIEEQIFYPATKDARTEEMLREAVEEHLSAKRLIADLLETDPSDAQFSAKMKVLKEQIEHHVEEEEKELFPTVKKVLDRIHLEELGGEMERFADELRAEGEPRMAVPDETDRPAPI